MAEIENGAQKCSENKRPKMSADTEVSGGIESFDGFVVEEVLSENSQTKMICVSGRFERHEALDLSSMSSDAAGAGDSQKPAVGVVIMEKTPFTEQTAKKILTKDTCIINTLRNDIYGTYNLMPEPSNNGVKTTVIYPATDKHLAKYRSQEVYLVHETPDDYKTITLPYIKGSQFSIQWVYNILEKKSEADRIVYEDPDPEVGFVLLPDMKWNGQQVEDLYLVAIIHKRDIRSIRELTASHIPLLKNILHKGQDAIEETYGVKRNQLRVYLHYQPSYYHLHVHFTHLKYIAPGIEVTRAHLLETVIDHIELHPDHYEKATLSYILKENDGLMSKVRDAEKKKDELN